MKTVLKFITAIFAFGLLSATLVSFRAPEKASSSTDVLRPSPVAVLIKVEKCGIERYNLAAFARENVVKSVFPSVDKYSYEWYKNGKFYSNRRVIYNVTPAKYSVVAVNIRTGTRGSAIVNLVKTFETMPVEPIRM